MRRCPFLHISLYLERLILRSQANILVNDDGTPCLADFGLSATCKNGASLTSALDGGGTIRWMAVEQFRRESGGPASSHGKGVVATEPTDKWSFGMVVLELLTGDMPFPEIPADGAVMLALLDGKRPQRPGRAAARRGLSSVLWQWMHQCWSAHPSQRPCLKQMCQVLQGLAQSWTPEASESPTVVTVSQRCSPGIALANSFLKESILIPPDMCKRIIGINGVNIRRLQSDYGVQLRIQDHQLFVSLA